MASSSGLAAMDEDELKGDGRKRRFKPLEAVRKLFGKGKRKGKDCEQVSVVAVKAKSTTALHSTRLGDDDEEDDDDGGFKNRQPRPLGGNRSISEDSIFSPDPQREPNLQALKKAAVSEESLPKSAFQAELLSKLSKRRSQYSDEDDGLPHSPTPPVTTADIIMGGPLKPLPAAGKSTSRESDNSLISNDASDNEEDDPFKSQWKSSVPSKVSKTPGESGGGAEAAIDFEKVGQTELLRSDIAKDRISIKPRKTRQSRKKRESQSPHSLPRLNEESPPKSRAETVRSSSLSESQVDDRPPGSPGEKGAGPATHIHLSKSPSLSSPTPRRPASSPMSTSMFASLSVGQDEKKEVTKEFDKRASLKVEPKSPPPPKEDVKDTSVKSDPRSFTVKEEEKRWSFTKSEPKSPTVKEFGAARALANAEKPEGESESQPKSMSASRTMESLKKESDVEFLAAAVREHGGSAMSRSMFQVSSSRSSSVPEPTPGSPKHKVEFSSSSTRSSDSSSHTPVLHTDPKPAAHGISSSVKTPSTADRTPSLITSRPTAAAATVVATSPGDGKKDGLRQTDSQASPAFSPKDDYKLRRQSRSKTLPEQPVSKEEPFAARVQRTASHRVEPSTSQNASPEASPRHREKVVEASKTKEPEWFALARRKTGRQESEEKEESPSPVRETAPAKEIAPTSVSHGSVSPAPSAKDQPVSKLVETSSNISVSSASSKFDKPSEVSWIRGGSVKTSPTKTPVFAHRGSSVKVHSVKTELGSAASSSATQSSSLKTGVSVSSASAVPGAKQDEVKEESKAPESSPVKDAPKWKTQSIKTPSAFSSGSSSVVSSSRFSGSKAPSQTGPTPLASSSAKTEARPLSSPAKTAPGNKTPAEEKDKPSVPAWRANLSQKKPASPDLKIELIESSKPSVTAAAAVASKKEESAKKEESMPKKEEPSTKVTGAAAKDVQQSDVQCRGSTAPSRTSKVMNLMKNFENVQGVS
ncbi:uncharacterized protein LOC143298994 isoform X2 [Babylonia areolata]|uniref:uncharacterized protein LOC143298994 isoform X2 n=1 Tax=Babylonia areolata TaxID=304850 RepID=UPI003FCEF5CF